VLEAPDKRPHFNNPKNGNNLFGNFAKLYHKRIVCSTTKSGNLTNYPYMQNREYRKTTANDGLPPSQTGVVTKLIY
jgi:hypothetical protein